MRLEIYGFPKDLNHSSINCASRCQAFRETILETLRGPL
jgi:hypothetical protein